MFQPQVKSFFLLAAIIVVLSGCAEKMPLFTNLDVIQFIENEFLEEPVPSELQPVPAEPEICLVQELDELRQTGSWVDTTESSANEVANDVTFEFPVTVNKQVSMYLKLFQTKQRKQLQRWLERSGKYQHMMKKELIASGLPTELVYLAMIESGFNQRAYSRARAVGLWQFMKGTARDFNLKIDRYVDERRHAEKSTKAAVTYLSLLYSQFGDWHLAVAAYNAGPGKIRYGLKKYKVKTFWELAEKKYLRLETKRYVPKLIAAILIAKEPEKYGFTNLRFKAPLRYDTLEVGPGLSLDAIALISKSSAKQIQLLNQELKTGKIPLNLSKYQVKIPAGTHEIAMQNMPRLHSVVTTGYKTHIIRKNESLSAICKKYNINTTTLLKVNNLRNAKLEPGQHLRIPHNTIQYHLLPDDVQAVAYSKNSLILHKIKKGESISKIAKRYNVPPEMIVSWNGLASVHKIRAGQQLALYINKGVKSSPTLLSVANQGKKYTRQQAPNQNHADIDNVIILAKGKKHSPPSTSGKRTFQWYQVQSGDTLWTISKKFKTSPKNIKKWNQLKSNLIHPGSRLKVRTA